MAKKIQFTRNGDPVVVVDAVRTPVGQVGKAFQKMHSFELGYLVLEEVIRRTNLDKQLIDGVVAGEISQSSKAPNVARVLSVKANLPLSANAVTIANNCVSGYEAIFEGARRLITGENELIVVVGEESMSNMPIYLDGAKLNSKTATVDKLKANWAQALELGIKPVDGVEEGLNDPIRDAMMFTTAEIVAQKLDLKRAQLDKYAYGSYKKAYEALTQGKYDKYLLAVTNPDGETLEKDEYIMSKVGFVEKPERFEKTFAIYEKMPGGLEALYKKFEKFIGRPYDKSRVPVVTLFNSCPQSDGAGALILTTKSRAQELGLPIKAIIRGWGYYGVDPSIMGLGIAYAMNKALENTGLSWSDIDKFEIHEAFAATALGSIMVVRDEFGYDLLSRLEKGDVNPNGGTLAIGHPLGATGVRILINQLMNLDEGAKYSLGGICAGGGVGGALVIEKP
ncbi:MAG: thiolase family protein [Leptospiraceae bacterium]|nr:thiolase family protein [Leptospiraceae bacterium]MDW8307051.1 thiolase family protein [Leptospiraceae bacterium]